MGKVFRLKKVLPSLLFAAGLVLPMFLSVVISANVFAAVPEGLVANDDDDFANVGELVTNGEIIHDRIIANSSNLYSGRMERGDIRIQNLKLSDAVINEKYSDWTLVTDENEQFFHKVSRGSKTSLVYTAPATDCSEDDSCHNLEIIFNNAAEVIQTGELLDLWVSCGWIMDDMSYTIVEDLPESRYTALAIGAGLLEGTPDYSQSMSDLFSFRVHKHGSRDIYGSPMISPVAIYDLDMPYCNPSGTVVWNSPFAEIAQPVYGFGDYPSNRIFIVNNSSISVYDTGTPSMPGPLARDITCSNLGKDVITHTLQTGFIMEGNFGSQPGLGINSFGTLGAQKVIDFNLVFPIVSVLAGEGGNVSATQQVVERNFGDPYVLQVTPDNGYNIKNIAIESLDTSSVIKNFTLEDFLAGSATVPGSVVTLDNGIQFKYKGDGVVNVILPAQYLLGTNDVTQPDYDDFEIVVTFEDENGNSDDPVVPNTGGDDIENPNTADVIYLPVITLGAAIAVLAYRKRRQI